MRSIPMLFNTEMVKALLAGRKTATRRPMPPVIVDRDGGRELQCHELAEDINKGKFRNSPVEPGDLIWVREAFRLYDRHTECPCYDYCQCPPTGTPLYRASHDDGCSKWSPSIHMPKAISRITLKVNNVYCQKLSEITNEQAVAEGMPTSAEAESMAASAGLSWYDRPRKWFQDTFSRIYINAYQNPWLFVYEFEVIQKNISEVMKGE